MGAGTQRQVRGRAARIQVRHHAIVQAAAPRHQLDAVAGHGVIEAQPQVTRAEMFRKIAVQLKREHAGGRFVHLRHLRAEKRKEIQRKLAQSRSFRTRLRRSTPCPIEWLLATNHRRQL